VSIAHHHERTFGVRAMTRAILTSGIIIFLADQLQGVVEYVDD
jgi:hypothetical protein